MRACLLPTQAGPLAGDRDRLRIVVGADATLVLRPVAATVALPGAGAIRLELDVEVGERGRLVLEDAPLIVAGGADVERLTAVRLAAGARAALRDVVVMGRSGEPGGRLHGTLRVCDDSGPLLHDELRLDGKLAAAGTHVALAPGHRVAGTLCLLGMSPAGDDHALRLARAGALRRATGPELDVVDAALAAHWERWAGLV